MISACRALLLAALFISGPLHAAPAKPNILWLIAEDFGQHLGCYGAKDVHTPNLDRLAAECARFTRFFTTAPVCSSSRSAFMTGLYQTSIGAYHHRSHREDHYTLPEGIRVLPEWLRDAGYFNANLFKLPPACGFDATAKDDWNFETRTKPWDSKDWADLKKTSRFTRRSISSKPTGSSRPRRMRIPPRWRCRRITRITR